MLVAAYLVEAGVLLILAPWTGFWDRNFFATAMPWLGAWMANEFVRGGVTGVGVVTAAVGLRDLATTIFARQTEGPDSTRGPA